MLEFKPFYEAVGLPKLNGVAINGGFCKPPRLSLIQATDIDPINNTAVEPDDIRSEFFFHSIVLADRLTLLKNAISLASFGR